MYHVGLCFAQPSSALPNRQFEGRKRQNHFGSRLTMGLSYELFLKSVYVELMDGDIAGAVVPPSRMVTSLVAL